MTYTLEEIKKRMDADGSLDLEGCTGITSLPEGLTVGGSLYLRGTGITSLPEGLKIRGNLFSDFAITYNEIKAHRLHEGDYIPGRYLFADGILCHVRRKKSILGGKYTYYIGKIKGKNVLSDGTLYAHCSTIRDGIADLEFKKQANRGTDRYTEMTKDSTVTYEEAIVMYRIITGACRQGTQSFLDTLTEAIKRKKRYTIAEIIEITKGQYGAESFRRFFEGRK